LTEWKLVEQAVNFAKANGAKEIILFGWSLGGMICGQYLKRASDTSMVRAAVFDSPMFDVRNTLRFQAGLSGYSDQFADEVCELISKSFLLRLLGYPVMKVDEFSLAKNPIDTHIPMLVLYSLNDGYIQIKDALEFAEINQNVVLQEFEGARHCRLRNSNVELYERTLKDFVAKL
jgi:pimeloyl-ACP methyl ester carboxylesterase